MKGLGIFLGWSWLKVSELDPQKRKEEREKKHNLDKTIRSQSQDVKGVLSSSSSDHFLLVACKKQAVGIFS